MNKFTKTSGWLGILFLIVSLFIYIISPNKDIHIYTALGVGATLLIVFFTFSRKMVKNVLELRQTKHGANSILMIVIAIAILTLINSISSRHKKRFDLTEAGIHSISEQTKNVLKNLKNDIKITGFFQSESMNMVKMKDLLEIYKNESKRITSEFIDPDKNPGVTKQYGIKNYGITVLESGKNETKVRDITEEAITNAIIKVTKDEKKKIYFLEGHGEHNIKDEEKGGYSQAKLALEGEGFEVGKLLMMQEGKVPEDADLLIVSGPEKPFLAQEKDAIADYLNKGGAAFFMVDPNFAPGMDTFLKRWGVDIGDNIIIDTISKIFGGDFTVPVVTDYAEHDITKEFSLATFFPMARSVEPAEDRKENITVDTLIRTGESSWGETDTKSRKVKFDKGKDKAGPVSIGVVVVSELNEEKTHLVIFGDSDFANNYYFSFSGNGDLFLNAVNWLTREENFITIRPKKRQFVPINITRAQGSSIFLFSLVIMPAAVLIAGVSRWWKRRRL